MLNHDHSKCIRWHLKLICIFSKMFWNQEEEVTIILKRCLQTERLLLMLPAVFLINKQSSPSQHTDQWRVIGAAISFRVWTMIQMTIDSIYKQTDDANVNRNSTLENSFETITSCTESGLKPRQCREGEVRFHHGSGGRPFRCWHLIEGNKLSVWVLPLDGDGEPCVHFVFHHQHLRSVYPPVTTWEKNALHMYTGKLEMWFVEKRFHKSCDGKSRILLEHRLHFTV